MPDLLTVKEIALLRRLDTDLVIAYRDSTVTPENRADCESIRRGIRDRLKPYQEQSLLIGSLLNKALVCIESQQATIKSFAEALTSYSYCVVCDGSTSNGLTCKCLEAQEALKKGKEVSAL
jgi:hypothetical protein